MTLKEIIRIDTTSQVLRFTGIREHCVKSTGQLREGFGLDKGFQHGGRSGEWRGRSIKKLPEGMNKYYVILLFHSCHHGVQ